MVTAGGAGPNPVCRRREAVGAAVEEHAGKVGTLLWGLGRDGSSLKERSVAACSTNGKLEALAHASHRGAQLAGRRSAWR
jgi:hypothetical protein